MFGCPESRRLRIGRLTARSSSLPLASGCGVCRAVALEHVESDPTVAGAVRRAIELDDGRLDVRFDTQHRYPAEELRRFEAGGQQTERIVMRGHPAANASSP